ncbi:MAG: tetratricopeptide repeat protein [Desulfurivibrionaceae bacterium]|nr:tetratricopeptide repeat protein [Desulfurivibrionaceae bacterium]
MINRGLHNPLIFVMAAAACLFGAGAGAADDCKALYEGILKERVLMQKKGLIEAALKTCPDDADISYQDGYILERFRRYEEALAAYRKTINLDPAYAKAYFSIGDIKASLNDYEAAAAAYREGLRYDPDNSRARSSLEEALAKIPQSATPPADSQEKPVVPAAAAAEEKGKSAIPERAAETTPPYLVKPISRLVIPFARRTTELSREARDVLSVVVGQAMNRDDMRDARFEIRGYADDGGAAEKNLDIAEKRAVAVKKQLTEEFGIDPERLKIAAHDRQPARPPVGLVAGNGVVFTKID